MDLPEQTLQDTSGVIIETHPQVSIAPDFYIEKTEPPGVGIPFVSNPLHADWITSLFIAALILYAIVAAFSRQLFAEIIRSFSFRTSAYQATDTHGIFSWQATLANLVSFINLSVFIYFLTINYGNWFPFGLDGMKRWGLLLGSVIVLVTTRHVVTVITGSISNTVTAFVEYLHNIYAGYRSIGLAIFPVNIAISLLYDPPVDILLKTGLVIIFITYIVRTIKLLVIFLQNRLPFYYYILYLCALEILPLALLYKLIIG
ncbi:MAG: DUF4271 domain-containing protein [Bacteroidales bacterium]